MWMRLPGSFGAMAENVYNNAHTTAKPHVGDQSSPITSNTFTLYPYHAISSLATTMFLFLPSHIEFSTTHLQTPVLLQKSKIEDGPHVTACYPLVISTPLSKSKAYSKALAPVLCAGMRALSTSLVAVPTKAIGDNCVSGRTIDT